MGTKPQDKSKELINKFGDNALSIVNETIDIWQTKLKYCEADNHTRGVIISQNTITFWNKVKNIINKKIC